MNDEVKRLLEIIQKLIASNALVVEFEACANDNGVETVGELCDYLEESMTYWPHENQ